MTGRAGQLLKLLDLPLLRRVRELEELFAPCPCPTSCQSRARTHSLTLLPPVDVTSPYHSLTSTIGVLSVKAWFQQLISTAEFPVWSSTDLSDRGRPQYAICGISVTEV